MDLIPEKGHVEIIARNVTGKNSYILFSNGQKLFFDADTVDYDQLYGLVNNYSMYIDNIDIYKSSDDLRIDVKEHIL